MGRTDDGVTPPGVPEAGDPDASASAESAQPMGVLWSWTPDSEPAPAAPTAPSAEVPPAKDQPAGRRGKLRKRKSKADSPVVEAPGPEPVVEASPEPGSTPLAAPVGKLWNATPEVSTPAAEVPLADRVAEVVREVEVASGVTTATDLSAGVLWSWTPPETDDAPAPAPVPVAVTPTSAAPPDVELVETPLDAEPTTVRAVMTLDPTLVLPPPPPLAPPIYGELIDEPLARVPAVRLQERRSVRVALGVLLVAVCAALPWVVPQIPDLFADAVPEQVSTPVTTDPSIEPPPPTPTLEPNESLSGKRLESAGTPLGVVVERLHVRSEVIPISGQSGALFPPDDPQVLGWWQEGRGVGAATGSAVVTGHTVSGGGGAFDHLGELVPGDQIDVRTAAGTIEYVVRETNDVSVGELARTAESIFRQDGPGRLVLITCSDFNGSVYLSNSIVYASPIADKPAK